MSFDDDYEHDQCFDFAWLRGCISMVMLSPHRSALLKLLNMDENFAEADGVSPILWNYLATRGIFKRERIRPMRKALEALGEDIIPKHVLDRFDAYEEKYLMTAEVEQ